jgi:hypothetical protein
MHLVNGWWKRTLIKGHYHKYTLESLPQQDLIPNSCTSAHIEHELNNFWLFYSNIKLRTQALWTHDHSCMSWLCIQSASRPCQMSCIKTIKKVGVVESIIYPKPMWMPWEPIVQLLCLPLLQYFKSSFEMESLAL